MSFSVSFVVDQGHTDKTPTEIHELAESQNPGSHDLVDTAFYMIGVVPSTGAFAFGDPNGKYNISVTGHYGETSRYLNVSVSHEGPLSEFDVVAAPEDNLVLSPEDEAAFAEFLKSVLAEPEQSTIE